MGLDQFAYRTKKGQITESVDFNDKNFINTKEIHYWRKHPNLQGWMKNLYTEKGGSSNFNCDNIQLSSADLLRLKQDINDDTLPETTGFFFGSNSDNEYREETLNFVDNALSAIEEGDDVYYTSWW